MINMRNVMLKSTGGNHTSMITLQHPDANPGFTVSHALNILITDVPDDVTNQDVVNLYSKTGVFHMPNSTYSVPYNDLGVGRALVVGK